MTKNLVASVIVWDYEMKDDMEVEIEVPRVDYIDAGHRLDKDASVMEKLAYALELDLLRLVKSELSLDGHPWPDQWAILGASIPSGQNWTESE